MEYVLEMEGSQRFKAGMKICGDVILKYRDSSTGRYICVLSDGLGSGVKANVLATLTARMALQYAKSEMDICRSAQTIMNTLPVCRERKISYATFSFFDSDRNGHVRIVEYDNPSYFFLRNGRRIPVEKQQLKLSRKNAFKQEYLLYSEIQMEPGDRLVFCSDGVTQAGLGTPAWPLGWREEKAGAYIESLLREDGSMSAGVLSDRFVERAGMMDGGRPKDDVSALSVYMRQPRELLLVTGPPLDSSRDAELAERVRRFRGRVVISGGTTANILSREWGHSLSINLAERTGDIPPTSQMEGADLVTEGMLTLNRVAELLERGTEDHSSPSVLDGATRLVRMVRNSDRIHFLVGTKINEAHQDPSVPVEIGIRRTIVGRIIRVLEQKYLKETELVYI